MQGELSIEQVSKSQQFYYGELIIPRLGLIKYSNNNIGLLKHLLHGYGIYCEKQLPILENEIGQYIRSLEDKIRQLMSEVPDSEIASITRATHNDIFIAIDIKQTLLANLELIYTTMRERPKEMDKVYS